MLNDVIRTLSFLQPKADDDFVDQLHYYYTTTFLIILAVLVSFKMFAGRPMECWIPAEYPKHWGDFAEMYCWAQNTYWLPFDEELPDTREHTRNYRQISYYQWVPFFLIFQAMFFYTPCLLWRFFNVRSGVIMQDILALARDSRNIHPEIRARNIEALAVHLESVFEHRFKLSTSDASRFDRLRGGSNRNLENGYGLLRYLNMRYYDGYMTTLYVVIKILYLINATGQLFLMNIFLQTSTSIGDETHAYRFYGFGVLVDLLRGRPWQTSGYFPRITMCDMQIRTVANVQRHTVQCVLALNIFTEKIFILLWILYSLLVCCTIFNLIFWLIESFSLDARIRFLARHLELAGLGYSCTYKKKKKKTTTRKTQEAQSPSSQKWWKRKSSGNIRRDFTSSKSQSGRRRDWNSNLSNFTREFVKLDGSFVLRMLTAHAGVMFTAELVEALWQLYDDRLSRRMSDPFDGEGGEPVVATNLIIRRESADDRTPTTDDPKGRILEFGSRSKDRILHFDESDFIKDGRSFDLLESPTSPTSLRRPSSPSPSSLLHQIEEETGVEEEEDEDIEEEEDEGGAVSGGHSPARRDTGAGVQFVESNSPRFSQPRASLMTLSTRQSLQQRRLSVKRQMANKKRSGSAPNAPSYV